MTAPTIVEKRCSICQRSLPLDAYWKNRHERLGVQAACSECAKARYFPGFRDGLRAMGWDERAHGCVDCDALITADVAVVCRDRSIAKRCRPCHRKQYRKAWGQRNRRRVLDAQQRWKERNPRKVRDAWLRRTYCISLDDYERMLARQWGRCGSCFDPPQGEDVLEVDHDHACCPGSRSCGRCVRGLLCDGCNRGAAALKDRVSAAAGLAAYLDRGPDWRSVRVEVAS